MDMTKSALVSLFVPFLMACGTRALTGDEAETSLRSYFIVDGGRACLEEWLGLTKDSDNQYTGKANIIVFNSMGGDFCSVDVTFKWSDEDGWVLSDIKGAPNKAKQKFIGQRSGDYFDMARYWPISGVVENAVEYTQCRPNLNLDKILGQFEAEPNMVLRIYRNRGGTLMAYFYPEGLPEYGFELPMKLHPYSLSGNRKDHDEAGNLIDIEHLIEFDGYDKCRVTMKVEGEESPRVHEYVRR